jgi:hypothetical protein
LNIATVRNRLNRAGFSRVLVSTNVGEIPHERANACQAALGVATAGADLIKFGLGELPLEAAVYQGREIVRTVRRWYPRRKLYPAVFIDDDMQRFFKALSDSPSLAKEIAADGVLIDTFNKSIGKGLLDYCDVRDIKRWAGQLHRLRKEAWIAGSIQKDELPALWAAGADVICVRGAACRPGKGMGRFGQVDAGVVRALTGTIPRHARKTAPAATKRIDHG